MNNNNNKTSALVSPLHMVVYFGFERSRKQAALKKKKIKENPFCLHLTRLLRQDLGESSTVRHGKLAPSPARLAAPRAPTPSLKRGRGGPGPAGGRRGAHTPDPAAARTVHCKQARGTDPLGSGAAAAQSPVSGVRPRTATLGSHTRTHTRTDTRVHTHPHTCRDRRIFTLAVDYCGVVGG